MLAVTVPDTGNVQVIIKAAKYKNAPGGDVKNSDLFGKEPVYNLSQAVNAGSNSLGLNTASYPKGFYRVYVVSGMDTLWDNIQIKH